MRILVTRPEPDASTFKKKLADMGHTAIVSPLMGIKFSKSQLPLNDVQALVVTSRNALRALARSPSLAKAIALPIFTVGAGSGAMAAELGFDRVIHGPASARELVPLIVTRGEPQGRPLLVLRGDRQAFDIKSALQEAGFSVTEKTVYRSVAADALEPEVLEGLKLGTIDGVILMSPRTAEVFVELTGQAGLAEAARHIHYFCLSGAVAKRLGAISPSICHVPANPNAEEMLALIGRMASKSH